MRGFLGTLYKEFIHLRRDPTTLVLTLAIPLMQILLFGYAINTDVKNIATVVYDMDQRRAGRELIAAYRNTDYFRIVGQVHSDHELNDAIVAGRAKVGIKIPSDFSDHLFTDRQATVLVLVDGSDSSIAMNALNVANAVGLRTSLDRLVGTSAAPAAS